MLQIGIIINPHSKKIKKMKSDPVEFYKKTGGDSVTVRLTNTLEEITKIAKEFKKLNISYLAISGGDGSIHHVISRFISVYKNKKLPAILILRDGSMNNIAKSYNLKGTGPVLLKKLINNIKQNNVKLVYRNTIKIDDKYCFMFGLGFIANFIYDFNKYDNKNLLKAVMVSLKAVWFFIIGNKNGLLNGTNLKVIIDGKELWFNNFFAIYASTIANIAISFKPTPRAYERDYAFHLIASGMKPGELLLRLNKFRKGIPVKHPNHFDDIASNIKIISLENIIYQMDGDIYESGKKLLVSTGPIIKFVSF